MKKFKLFIAVFIFAAIVVLGACIKENIAPAKAATIYVNFKSEVLADSTDDPETETPIKPPSY